MNRLRKWRKAAWKHANRVSSNALARAEHPDWFDTTTDNGWIVRTLTRPRYFTDAAALEMFINAAASADGIWIEDNAEGKSQYAQGIDDVAKLAPTVAQRPAVFRKTINVHTSRGDGITPDGKHLIHYLLRQRAQGTRASTVIKSNDLSMLNGGMKLLIKHTEPLNKAQIRAKIPLVEPYTILDEATARREHEIANRARIQGAIWGGVTGFVTAAITSIATLIAR